MPMQTLHRAFIPFNLPISYFAQRGETPFLPFVRCEGREDAGDARDARDAGDACLRRVAFDKSSAKPFRFFRCNKGEVGFFKS